MLEIIIAVTVVGILSSIAVPRTGAMLDRIAVRGATADAVALLERGRHAAMTQGARATVDIDTAHTVLVLRVGHDTLQRRDESALNRVNFRATRTSVSYTQIGLGFGVSNLTLIVARGAAADTITVSRLGRVRR